MYKINPLDKTIYGVGNLSNGVILQALTTYLVFFGTTILGVSGTVVGIMVAVSVIWDAVSDPLIGHISDYTTSSRFGRRHQFMIVGGIGLAVFNAMLWSIQASWSSGVKTTLLFVSVIFVKSFMTILITPYTALGAELTNDYHERTSIQAYRTVFFTLGMAFTTVAGMFFYFRPSEAYEVGQLNPAAYQNLGMTISAIIILCTAMVFFGTFKYIPGLPQAAQDSGRNGFTGFLEAFKSIFDNRNYLLVAGAYLSANIGSAILGAIGLHVFTYTFGMDNVAIGVIFGTMFGLTILSQFIWVNITKHHDKKYGALLAVAFALTGSLIFLIMVFYRGMVVNQYLWLILYAVPSGIGFGGLITLPYSMIADTVDEEELAIGHRSEGLYYGGLTFSYKMSQSVAILLVGIGLDLAGFDSALVSQTEGTVVTLGLVVALGTIIPLIAAGYYYSKYALTKAKVDEIKILLGSNER